MVAVWQLLNTRMVAANGKNYLYGIHADIVASYDKVYKFNTGNSPKFHF